MRVDKCDLSAEAHTAMDAERQKYQAALLHLMKSKHGDVMGAQRFDELQTTATWISVGELTVSR